MANRKPPYFSSEQVFREPDPKIAKIVVDQIIESKRDNGKIYTIYWASYYFLLCPHLTPRQREIVEMIARGYTGPTVAKELQKIESVKEPVSRQRIHQIINDIFKKTLAWWKDLAKETNSND